MGRAKRRLAKNIGSVAAIAFYRLTLHRTIRRLGYNTYWHSWLFLDNGASRWPANTKRRFQVRGNIGRRMDAALRSLPPGPVILVGTDIPAIKAHYIKEAFRKLSNADVVFGPSLDGGYWLVGISSSRTAPRLFDNVRWSTKYALYDTMANLPSGLVCTFAATLFDVDNVEAYNRWRSAIGS